MMHAGDQRIRSVILSRSNTALVQGAIALLLAGALGACLFERTNWNESQLTGTWHCTQKSISSLPSAEYRSFVADTNPTLVLRPDQTYTVSQFPLRVSSDYSYRLVTGGGRWR